MSTNKSTGKCPITFALDIFGDRWSLLIVRDIVFRGKRNYSEFAKSSEKISTNILANRLARLESDGILVRRPDPENGAKVDYVLAEKGRQLIPVLLEILIWSAHNDPLADLGHPIIHGADPDLLDRAQDDREALIAELISKLPT